MSDDVAIGLLVEAYLDRSIDSAGAQTLVQALRAGGPPRAQVLRLLAISGRMTQLFDDIDATAFVRGFTERLQSSQDASSFQRAVDRSLEQRPTARHRLRRSRRRPAIPFFVAAASLALAVGAVVWWSATPRAPAWATLSRAQHGTQVFRAEHEIEPGAGLALRPDDRIQTDADGGAEVRYPDQTRVDVLADSRMRLWTEDGAKRVQLERGGLQCEVTSQPAGQAMRFTTPQAEAVVVGTRLRLAVDGAATRLDVIEGRVEVHRRSGAQTMVVTGEYAMVQDGLELAAWPRMALWSDGFEDLSAWGPEPFGNWPSLGLAPERGTVHAGAQAMRLRYRFSNAAGSAASNVRFTANYRSLARAVRLPAETARLRLWVHRVSATPEAWIILRLRNADIAWEAKFYPASCANDWQPLDLDFAHPPSYWHRDSEGSPPSGYPPVRPLEITHLVLIAGGGDFDIVVDDLEAAPAVGR